MSFQKTAYLAQIIACAGIIPGFLGIFYSIEQTRKEEEKTSKAMRLAALGAVNQMIEKDIQQQQKIREVVATLKTLPPPEELLKQKGTGKEIYYGIDGFAQVGRHYEHLGAMLRLGYIDFDLIFEVVAFPDDFWDAAQPYLTVIRENWSGPGKPLPDLWKNFGHLKESYYVQRAANKAAKEAGE